MDYFSRKISKNNKNQSHLPIQDTIKSRGGGPLNCETVLSKKKSEENSTLLKNEEMIIGLPNKSDLLVFFNQKKDYYKELMTLFENICENLGESIEKHWSESEKERVKIIQVNKKVEKKKVENYIEHPKKTIVNMKKKGK